MDAVVAYPRYLWGNGGSVCLDIISPLHFDTVGRLTCFLLKGMHCTKSGGMALFEYCTRRTRSFVSLV